MKTVKIISFVCLLSISTILIHSCSKSDTNNMVVNPPGTNVVNIQGMAFQPATLTVVVGSSITWTNKDAQDHTVTSDDGTSFNSGTINPGASFTITVNTLGSYAYHCSIHPTMTGTIQVVTR